MWKSVLVIAVVAALACVACRTQFYGSARVPDGRAGCQATCKQLGMELAGMVVMGQYSDGCICAVPSRSVETEPLSLVYVGANGAAAATAGVVRQTTDEEDRRRCRKHYPDFMCW